MNNKYFRITGYCPENDFCFIMDANGMFDELWQFSSMLVKKGLKVLEITSMEKIIDVNITPVEEDTEHIILRANADGKPEFIDQTIDGVTYRAIKVGTKIYIPDKEKQLWEF